MRIMKDVYFDVFGVPMTNFIYIAVNCTYYNYAVALKSIKFKYITKQMSFPNDII